MSIIVETTMHVHLGGKRDILSNFHYCDVEYNGTRYTTREQAIQHQKAIMCNYANVAEAIMQTNDPASIKRFGKCAVKNDTWNRIENEVIEEICYSAAKQNEDYRQYLLDSGEMVLVEAIPGEYEWGSGLSHQATQCSLLNRIPGNNRMGQILMCVRRRLYTKLHEYYDQPKQSTPKNCVS